MSWSWQLEQATTKTLAPLFLMDYVFGVAVPGGFLHRARATCRRRRRSNDRCPVRFHLDKVVHALLNDPPGLFIKALAEMALELPAVFTGVMPGEDFPALTLLSSLIRPDWMSSPDIRKDIRS